MIARCHFASLGLSQFVCWGTSYTAAVPAVPGHGDAGRLIRNTTIDPLRPLWGMR